MRKFFFFLDARRRGRIAIKEVLCSPILQELLDLRRPDLSPDDLRCNWFSQQSAAQVRGCSVAVRGCSMAIGSRSKARRRSPTSSCSPTADPPHSPLSSSLSSYTPWHPLQVYDDYLQLDADQNGMLSASELARWRDGGLTTHFVARLFQEVNTYPNKDGMQNEVLPPSPSPTPTPSLVDASLCPATPPSPHYTLYKLYLHYKLCHSPPSPTY